MTLISIRRPKVKISALKSYRTPKYPKAGEELDFDLNDTSHWPFAPALASAVLASALVTGSGRVTYAGEGHAHVAATRAIESKAVPNPFGPKERSRELGGKGGPMTMPREMAMVAIAKGFEKSGIKFQSSHRYKEGGVQVELDGYDDKKAIGFELVKRWGGEVEMTLQPDEVARLDKDAELGKRQIAAIYLDDRRFTGHDRELAAKQLTKAVQQYVDYLRSSGAL